MRQIMETFAAFEETEESKLFDNAEFGYWKVTVERPLRLSVDLSHESRTAFRALCVDAGEDQLADLADRLAAGLGPGPHTDFNVFLDAAAREARNTGLKLTAKRKKLLRTSLATADEEAAPIVRKTHRPGAATPDPLHGRFAGTVDSAERIVEYEPDTDLRDTEQIPLLEDGGIKAFIHREVLPYVADAWVDDSKTKNGYEISFNRYFYKPEPMRPLEEIRADILAVMKESEGLVEDILFDGRPDR